jgi:Predicted transcriptional regulator containing an HTH domain and an uncharacterized domain shared with the mammalian protein Schlafen
LGFHAKSRLENIRPWRNGNLGRSTWRNQRRTFAGRFYAGGCPNHPWKIWLVEWWKAEQCFRCPIRTELLPLSPMSAPFSPVQRNDKRWIFR